ncbi:MAG TPA: beta-propeller fold lactonase family protein [Kiritimatiellia bacterium]|nr:beta-propeller fold lactonase family protein [Kiritimatiellia bacterium]
MPRVFFGCYTDGAPFFADARGRGILRSGFDEDTGRFTPPEWCADIVNPSWLCASGRGDLLAVSETFRAPGRVLRFGLTDSGPLIPRGDASSEGLATCHVADAGDFAFAASYLDGRLTAYSLAGGGLAGPTAIHTYEGRGPDADRQTCAHAHHVAISPWTGHLCVCDLGSDAVWVHPPYTGEALAAPVRIPAPPGSGPRHGLFHPLLPLFYVVTELDPQVLVYDVHSRDGALTLRDVIRLRELPGLDSAGGGAALRLHPDSEQLALSERSGHRVALFHLDREGRPRLERVVAPDRPTDRTPRDIAFSPGGNWLLIAYQDGHRIRAVPLAPTSHETSVNVGSPSCIAFA